MFGGKKKAKSKKTSPKPKPDSAPQTETPTVPIGMRPASKATQTTSSEMLKFVVDEYKEIVRLFLAVTERGDELKEGVTEDIHERAKIVLRYHDALTQNLARLKPTIKTELERCVDIAPSFPLQANPAGRLSAEFSDLDKHACRIQEKEENRIQVVATGAGGQMNLCRYLAGSLARHLAQFAMTGSLKEPEKKG